MIYVGARLEFHLTDNCNLACLGCNHFSDQLSGGTQAKVALESQLVPWSERVVFREVTLLGGEPTLNSELVSIVRMVRQLFPATPITMVSNGFALARHNGLEDALRDLKVTLNISVHEDSPAYKRRLEPILRLVEKWKSRGITVNVWESWRYWESLYQGVGETIMPVGNGDSKAAWKVCSAARYRCFQLRNGAIWKCPMLAYLPLLKKRYPSLSAVWDASLKYEPLKPTASDSEIVQFFQCEAEDVCGLCSNEGKSHDI
jgi:MoaA/NifB/PqqE/SkfB family radical SAM enzyme